MTVPLVNVDIYYNETLYECVAITAPHGTLYVRWNQLTPYDQQLFSDVYDAVAGVMTTEELSSVVLPNGMPFLTTYRDLMKLHPSTPPQAGNDYDNVYYNGSNWKRLTTDQTIV